MMLAHIGEPQAAALLEAALWRVYAEGRIPFLPGGAVAGGAPVVTALLGSHLDS
jgi:hypothetical protein